MDGMDQVINSLVSSSPGAAALLIGFFMFARMMAKRDDALKDIGKSCHAAHSENIDKITAAQEKQLKVVDSCATRMIDAVDKCNTLTGKALVVLERVENNKGKS